LNKIAARWLAKAVAQFSFSCFWKAVESKS